MREITLTVFIVVLAVDLIYKISRGGDTDLLGASELILLALMVFVATGERIVKFVIGKGWITIEQKLEKQAKEAEEDAKALIAISETDDPDVVEQLLTRATGQDKDVWSRMVVYRLTMRVLMRRICKAYGMALKDTTAFISMLGFLKHRGALNANLQKGIEFIRDTTFFFEWGTGRVPDAASIKKALEQAPTVVKELERVVEGLEK